MSTHNAVLMFVAVKGMSADSNIHHFPAESLNVSLISLRGGLATTWAHPVANVQSIVAGNTARTVKRDQALAWSIAGRGLLRCAMK